VKRGEKYILITIALVVLALGIRNFITLKKQPQADPGIPFYTTASPKLMEQASAIYKQAGCKGCHSLWSVRNMMESVPAPALDGIGNIRSQEWLYNYLSSPDPQSILPSRLKAEYKMPSYAYLSDEDRHVLAQYLASLQVQDWYKEEAAKAEFEKLTGKEYKP
jgi:cbb3-type cytochrome oxidase cytochrome c subunit